MRLTGGCGLQPTIGSIQRVSLQTAYYKQKEIFTRQVNLARNAAQPTPSSRSCESISISVCSQLHSSQRVLFIGGIQPYLNIFCYTESISTPFTLPIFSRYLLLNYQATKHTTGRCWMGAHAPRSCLTSGVCGRSPQSMHYS